MFQPSPAVLSWVIKPVLLTVCLIPLGYLIWRAMLDQLGANPVETLTHQTGLWGLYFLLITLSVTPLRQLLNAVWLIRIRRMLGLMAFFYACLHFLVYLWLDQYFSWSAIIEDVFKRPYITIGFTALLLLLPLALTSTKSAIRRLGKKWKQLHKLVYLVAGLVILHFIWLVKADYAEPLFYLLLFLMLMLVRLPAVNAVIKYK